MIVIIAISLFIALCAAFAVYSNRRRGDRNESPEFEPSRFKGLFSDRYSALEPQSLEEYTPASAARAALLERSRGGDLSTLTEARSAGEPTLYSEVLDGLIDSTSGSKEAFASLVTHIANGNELRGNKRLAERSIDYWETSVDRGSTTRMIHLAALSDDAAVYERAVELAVEYFRRGALEQFSAEELIELLESQYWILAPESRRGGAGFALKRKLAEVRRELATVTLAR